MPIELRMCPCCGFLKGKPTIIEQGYTQDALSKSNYRVQCLECGLMTMCFDEKELAVIAWNERCN